MTGTPDPQIILHTLTGYQRSAALKAAIELDLFTAIAEGVEDIEGLAARLNASRRGVRILCDYLVASGFLLRSGDGYRPGEVAATFLDRRQPTYLGSVSRFLNSDTLRLAFEDITNVVRRGGTQLGDAGTMRPQHPVWVDFARAMQPLAAVAAGQLAQSLIARGFRPANALDVAAGHGLYGVRLAQAVPGLVVTALDWAEVLRVARDNAVHAAVADRLILRPGNALSDDLGGGYDLVLLPNFLHHFDPATVVAFLRRVINTLVPGGKVVVVETLVGEDRVSPAQAAMFGLVMLATTTAGDVFSESQLSDMLADAGFTVDEVFELPSTMFHVLIATPRPRRVGSG